MTTQREKATACVQLDNHQVIVTRWDFPPGSETGWHTHGHDYVVVPVADGSMQLQTPQGERQITLTTDHSHHR